MLSIKYMAGTLEPALATTIVSIGCRQSVPTDQHLQKTTTTVHGTTQECTYALKSHWGTKRTPKRRRPATHIVLTFIHNSSEPYSCWIKSKEPSTQPLPKGPPQQGPRPSPPQKGLDRHRPPPSPTLQSRQQCALTAVARQCRQTPSFSH